MVIDRAIGHARGNGPADPRDAEQVPATTETPFCVYSTSKAVTAMVVHVLDEGGALSIDDRVADHIPEYARHGKGEITIGQVLSTGPVSRASRATRSTSTGSTTASS